MEGATTTTVKVNNNEDILSTEFNTDTEEASSNNFNFFIKDIPEGLKLLTASIFVAFILHNFFFRGNNNTKKRSYSSHSSTVASKVASKNSGYYAASDDGTDDDYANGGKTDGYVLGGGCDDDDAATEIIQEETEQGVNKKSVVEKTAVTSLDNEEVKEDSTKIKKAGGKKVKLAAAKMASDKRNYDRLICKVVHDDDDNDKPKEGDDGAAKGGASESKPQQQQQEQQESTAAQPTPPSLPLKLHSQTNHPGLTAYYNWHATITSLYRIYTIPSYDTSNTTSTFIPAILPMQPSSERGKVAIHITVYNQTQYESIQVYWVDYRGNEVYKGSIPKGGQWIQTTYIGHPWTFRVGNVDNDSSVGGEENVLLKYVPFRVIPSVIGAETTTEEEGGVGTQQFTLRDVPQGYVTRNEGYIPQCWVDDTILPEPPLIRNVYNNDGAAVEERNLSLFTMHEMQMAIRWSCLQIQREDISSGHSTGIMVTKRLLQYLKNICMEPHNAKYRKLRTSNRIFFDSIYSTGARGVLLALGFEEHMGYMECGPSEDDGPLNYERLRQISDAMMVVNETLKVMMMDGSSSNNSSSLRQPSGVDGYGRAGFGHAGGMNL